jgi:hypothetical protein
VAKKTAQFSSALILAALSAFASAGGCGGGLVAAACDRICFCQQCSVADRDACEDKAAAAQETAIDRNCGQQFEAYARCLDTQVRCENMRATIEACSEERAVVNKCTQLGAEPFDPSSGNSGDG